MTIPEVHFFKGRGYVLRSALNQYKVELQAFSLGVAPVATPAPDPDPFVPLKQVAAELGIGRRTIGRRIAESRIPGFRSPEIFKNNNPARVAARTRRIRTPTA